MSYLPHALHSSAADEVLYGRAGFLFCLLLVWKYVGKERCERFGVDTATRKVFDAIAKSGEDKSSLDCYSLQKLEKATNFLGTSREETAGHVLNAQLGPHMEPTISLAGHIYVLLP